MPFITTKIDIAASPAEVRKAFLDFESYPTWAKAMLKAIEVSSGDQNDLKPGDQLKVTAPGMTLWPMVLTNTAEEFKWSGSFLGLIRGDHSFQFSPSTTTPGHTTLVNSEEMTGLLSFLFGPTWSQGKQSKANFEGFNNELKAKVEGYQS